MNNTLHLLLVDDNSNDRELVMHELRQQFPEVQVEQAASAEELAQVLEKSSCEIVIVDYQLVWTNGLTVLQAAKARWPDCAVIMFTGSGNEEVAVEAMKAGLDDYIVKSPKHFGRLLATVRSNLEQIRQRRALKETQISYLKLFEAVPIGLYRMNLKGQFLDANSALVQILGYPDRLALLAVNEAELYVNAEDHRRWQDLMERYGVVRNFETRLRRREGATLWVRNSARAIRNEAGQIAYYDGSLMDLTERRKVEERQKALTTGLRAVVASADELINCPDVDTVFRRAVELGREKLGLERCAIFLDEGDYFLGTYGTDRQGRTSDEHAQRFPKNETWQAQLQSLGPQADPWAVVREMRRAWDGEKTVELEEGWIAFAPIRSAQRLLGIFINDAAISGAALDPVKQEVMAVFCSLLGNIVERKRAEADLAQERNLLRTLIDHLPDNIFVKDTHSRMILDNAAHRSLLGAERLEAVVGKTDFDFFGPELATQYFTDEQAILQSGQPLINREEPTVDSTGKPHWLLTTKVPLQDVQGKIIGLVGINREITERKHAEQALERSLSLLQATLESTADGLLVVDDKGKIISFNHKFVEMWRLPETIIAARDDNQALDFVLSQLKEPEVFLAGVRSLYAQPDSESYDVLEFKDERIFERYSQPQRIGGKSVGRVWSFRDITQRKQHEREQAAIVTMAAALRTAMTQAEMLPIILDHVLNLLQADSALLAMRDPATGDTVIELGRGAGAKLTGQRLLSGEGVSAQVLATGQAYWNNDAQNDPAFKPAEQLQELPAIACVPLITQGQALGALWIGRKTEIAAGEVRLLTAIGDIAASAIYRATLYDQTEQRLQRLAALRDIDKAITASLDLRVTLNILLDQVTTQLRVEAASVLLLQPHSQMLEYAAGRGFWQSTITQTQIYLGEGPTGQAALERRLISIPDLRQVSKQFGRAKFLASEMFVAYYALPLIAKGLVVGVLEIFHRSPLDPDPEWVDFLEALGGEAAIAIENTRLFDDLQRSNVELSLAYDLTLEGWSHALDLRDKETEGHTQRVTEMTVRLARALGLSEVELVHIRRGALLHDIGKMGIPDSVLLKPGPLTDEEWEVMRRHPVYAYEMLAPITYLTPALDIPYCHHEKWDGTGYPRGLKGETIPLAARLFAVVDVWDALNSNRPYRPAWPKEKVREHIQSLSGTHFEPRVVETFLNLIAER